MYVKITLVDLVVYFGYLYEELSRFPGNPFQFSIPVGLLLTLWWAGKLFQKLLRTVTQYGV